MKFLSKCVDFRDVFKQFDLEDKGYVTGKELALAGQTFMKKRDQLRRTQRMLYAAAFIMLFMLACMFGLTYAVVELAKDFTVDQSGRRYHCRDPSPLDFVYSGISEHILLVAAL